MWNTKQSKPLPLQTASVGLTDSPGMYRMHRIVIERLGAKKMLCFSTWLMYVLISSILSQLKIFQRGQTIKNNKNRMKRDTLQINVSA